MSLWVIIAVVVLAGIALKLGVPSLSKDSVAGGIVTHSGKAQLADCPDSPNCHGSESNRSSQRSERLALSKPATAAISTLAEVINSLPGTTIVKQDERYLHATFSTRLMGYIDDVEFLLSDDQQSVQVRSASRLGKSDLGANAKRIAMLNSLLETRL